MPDAPPRCVTAPAFPRKTHGPLSADRAAGLRRSLPLTDGAAPRGPVRAARSCPPRAGCWWFPPLPVLPLVSPAPALARTLAPPPHLGPRRGRPSPDPGPSAPPPPVPLQNLEKQMRQLAVIPPMLYDADQQRIKFINMNGLMDDPMKVYKDRQVMNMWSEQEKETFREK